MAAPTKRITDFTTAGTISGPEEVPVFQTGATRKVTIANIFANLGLDITSLAAIIASAVTTATKAPVRVATTVAGTLASSFENGDTVDGVTLVTGDRILIRAQATASENGIYTVNVSGAPTRATDFDANAEVKGGCVIRVSEGSAFGDRSFVLTTNNPITVGTTGLGFALVPTGQELGYSESTAGKTSTNTSSWLSDKISGVSLTIIGTGRPVEVQWGAGLIVNSVAGNWTEIGLIIGGVIDEALVVSSPSTSVGRSGTYTRRMTLTAGTSYTFELGVAVQGGTAVISSAERIFLAVTER